MYKINNLKLARKLMASKRRGLIIGVGAGLLICLIVVAALLKYCWLKKKFDCMTYDLDDLDCDFADEECNCDADTGCSFTSEKDFQ